MAKLELSLKSLRITLSVVDQQWRDEAHHKFQENHIAPIEPNVKSMLDAVGRMAEAIAACERQCDSDYGL